MTLVAANEIELSRGHVAPSAPGLHLLSWARRIASCWKEKDKAIVLSGAVMLFGHTSTSTPAFDEVA